MSGAHSSRSFTMDEVLDILDDVKEVICDGSDDDLGMGSDSDDSEVDDQRYILYNKVQWLQECVHNNYLQIHIFRTSLQREESPPSLLEPSPFSSPSTKSSSLVESPPRYHLYRANRGNK